MKSTKCYPNVGVVHRRDDSMSRWRFLGCFAVFSWPAYTLSFHHPTCPSVRARKGPTQCPTLRASTQGGDGRAQNSSRAFRLAYFSDLVELQTATYKLLPKLQLSRVGSTGNVESQAEVILTSMVHLADDRYYDEIMLDAASFDRVLFELIVGPDVYGFDEDGKKTILANVFPTREQEVLARNYGLSPQLNCLDYCELCKQRLQDGASPRWVLADLSRDEIQRLQKASGEREIGQPAWRSFIEEVGQALVVGIQAGEKDLPRFFPPLGSYLNKPALLLRALLWLAPCPEAEIMLLDWARTYPRAGGISAVVSTIAEAALSGDLFTARKLGFAQEIVSGQVGGSNWGLTDDVVISARNRVAVEETERALADGCRKVMILYGGLHIQDLASQLCKRLDASQEMIGWKSAWKIATKARIKANSKAVTGTEAEAEAEAGVLRGTTAAPTPDSLSTEGRRVATFADQEGDLTAASFTKWGTLAMLAFAYVAIGAWDWTDTVEALERYLVRRESSLESLASAFGICVLYVARHAYLYYGLARWLVQWEKQLF